MSGNKHKNKLHYRAVFISDIHLGSNGSRAKDAARFLKRVKCERIYLVGDIIDMWRLRRRWFWPAGCNDFVRRILKHVKNGTEVIYIPGNHDEGLRPYCGLEFGGVKVESQCVHETADGRRLLVTHGDQYDLIIQNSRLISVAGSIAYETLLNLNIWYNRIRRAVGMKYWSLSYFAKLKVKKACTFISRFETTLLAEAKRRGLDGVVCGHIHKEASRFDEETGLWYFNCGDWVEGGTALVEHDDGRIETIDAVSLVQDIHEQHKLRFAPLVDEDQEEPVLFEAAV